MLGATSLTPHALVAHEWLDHVCDMAPAPSDRNRPEDTCATARTCSSDTLSDARTKLIVADVSFGVSVVALGLAAYWLFDSKAKGTF